MEWWQWLVVAGIPAIFVALAPFVSKVAPAVVDYIKARAELKRQVTADALAQSERIAQSEIDRRAAVEDKLSAARDELVALKGKVAEFVAENVRLKGELAAWQQQQPRSK